MVENRKRHISSQLGQITKSSSSQMACVVKGAVGFYHCKLHQKFWMISKIHPEYMCILSPKKEEWRKLIAYFETKERWTRMRKQELLLDCVKVSFADIW